MRVFLDFEFTGLQANASPISIGIVAEDGREFYAEYTDYNHETVDQWIKDNVIANLLYRYPIPSDEQRFCRHEAGPESPLNQSLHLNYSSYSQGHRYQIREDLTAWLAQFDKIEVWSDCYAYDWVFFCDIFGGAFGIPKHIYYIPFDLSTYLKLAGFDPDIDRSQISFFKDCGHKHNALTDAKYIRLWVLWLDKSIRFSAIADAIPSQETTWVIPEGSANFLGETTGATVGRLAIEREQADLIYDRACSALVHAREQAESESVRTRCFAEVVAAYNRREAAHSALRLILFGPTGERRWQYPKSVKEKEE